MFRFEFGVARFLFESYNIFDIGCINSCGLNAHVRHSDFYSESDLSFSVELCVICPTCVSLI